MRGRAARAALPLIAVLALVAVVAIAASGSTPHGTAEARAPSDSLLDAFFTLWILGAVAGGVLLVYGLTQRKAIAAELASGRYKRTSLAAFLTMIVIIVGAISIARRLNLKRHSPHAIEEEPPLHIGQALPTTPDRKPTVTYEPGISWLVVAMVVGLVLAAAVAYLVSRRRARGLPAPDLAEQLAAALDDAVDDLRRETDPRRAIIAAYARMERVLAAGGTPAQPAETPDEYLARVLLELTPESDAVSRLTGLFTQAKFSHHEIDATMKEEAIDAFERVRDELRSRAERTAERTTPSATLEAAS